jgi:hypothetical protein
MGASTRSAAFPVTIRDASFKAVKQVPMLIRDDLKMLYFKAAQV